MKIEEIEKLCEEATSGPWTWRVPGYLCNKYIDNGLVLDINEEKNGVWHSSEDAKFIASSRTLMPKLLAVAKAAKMASEKIHEVSFLAYFADMRKALEELEKE